MESAYRKILEKRIESAIENRKIVRENISILAIKNRKRLPQMYRTLFSQLKKTLTRKRRKYYILNI